MMYSSNDQSFLPALRWRHLVFTLAAAVFLHFSPAPAHAQTESMKGESRKGDKNSIEAVLPDDSLLIYQGVIDGIPEDYDKEKQCAMLEAHLKESKFSYDKIDDPQYGRVYFTREKDVTKDLNFMDRKVELMLAYVVQGNDKITTLVYGREKLNSRGRNWDVLSKKTKDRVLNWNSSFNNNVKKRVGSQKKIQKIGKQE